MVTGCVVAIVTAGVDEVDSQLPLYVPPVVIVMGPVHGPGSGGDVAALAPAE
jgi:hypothetical protein